MAMVVTVAAMGVMVAAMEVMEVMVVWEVMEGTVGMDHMEWVIDEFMKVILLLPLIIETGTILFCQLSYFTLINEPIKMSK